MQDIGIRDVIKLGGGWYESMGTEGDFEVRLRSLDVLVSKRSWSSLGNSRRMVEVGTVFRYGEKLQK